MVRKRLGTASVDDVLVDRGGNGEKTAGNC